MIVKALFGRFRATFFRRRRDAELNEEIEAHLSLLAAAYRDRGMTASEAGLAARRDFGGVELTKQIYREHRGIACLENLFQDLRLASRSLHNNPGFAAIAVGSLVIGIGANTAMFSVVGALKFRSLPVPRPRELVQVHCYSPEFKTESNTFSYPFLKELSQAKLFHSTAAMFPISVSMFGNGSVSQESAELVTGSYFRTLAVKPALGRLLTPADMNSPGANAVCVISHRLWLSRFGGQAAVLHNVILLNGRRFQIVGVAQPGFEGSVLYWPHDIQIPVSMTAGFMHDFPWKQANSTFLYIFARLNPNTTRITSEARLRAIAPRIGTRIDSKQPAQRNRFDLLPASQGPGLMDDKTSQLALLSGVVLATLLIACANIACLLLARANAQQRETAVQVSLGAPRSRIVQRYLVESALIAAAGGLLALPASYWLTRVFLHVLNLGSLRVEPDAGMLLFTLAACAVTAILFGAFPGWQAARVKVHFSGLSSHGSARHTRRRNLFSKALVACQIALATILLLGFALFLRSLQKVQAVPLGFDPSNVLIVNLDPGKAGRSNAKSLAIYRTLVERVRSLPDVEAASLAYGIPLSGFSWTTSFETATLTSAKVQNRIIPGSIVAADYFRTLRIPLLQGRDFNTQDFKRMHTVIVNRAFTSYYQLGDHAVGRHFKLDEDTVIVGVVGDSKQQLIREEAPPAMFLPVSDDSKGQLAIVARTRGGSSSVFREIRSIVESVDSQTPVIEEQSLTDMVSRQFFDQRAITTLCSIFSVFALALSCMGLYGVAAYSITGRTQEIGVRFAVGACRADVARLFLQESSTLIVAGLAVGIPVALALSSLLKALLFGIEPADPLTIACSTAALIGVCLAAAALPLRKAFAVDPATALRGE